MSDKFTNGLNDNLKYNQTVKPNTAFLQELQQKLPEFFSDSGGFDVQKFLLELKDNNVNELSSGYQLDFIGKDYAKKQAGERPTTVIVPDIIHNTESKNKSSKNLFFTGDNLEVLRHLQSNYQNSVDYIYIDPPYNTGSDGFVYPDSFEYKDEELKDMFGLNEMELGRLKSIQGKATHSAWLAFMYPRLYLAKKLLKDTGIIFVSIDDNEHANLKLLMDDVFGERNFVGNIAWESKTKSQNTKTSFDKLQPKVEHILVYEKQNHRHFNLIPKEKKEYSEVDEKGKYRNYILEEMSAEGVRARATMIFDIKGVTPSEGKQWKIGKTTIDKYIDNDELSIKNGKVIIKIRPEDEKSEKYNPFWAFIPKTVGTAESAKTDLNKLMGKRELFDTVKPVDLIKQLIYQGANDDALVLDFFAGSGTTADAVMQLNNEDGGNRKYIMVQLPEPLDINSSAYKAGYKTIDEISRARINKVAEKIGDTSGFKHYIVEKVKVNTIDKMEEFDPNLLVTDDLVSDVRGGVDTLLTTWLVADGYKFNEIVEKKTFDNANAY